MRDVGAHLVPAGDDPLPLAHHRQFLDHMAQLHARSGASPTSSGCSARASATRRSRRHRGPERERAAQRGTQVDPVPAALEPMWERLRRGGAAGA